MTPLNALYYVLIAFIFFVVSFIGYEIISHYKPFKRFSDLFKSNQSKQEFITYIYEYDRNMFQDDYTTHVIYKRQVLK